MKSEHDRCIGEPSSAVRRNLLRAAVAGAGLTALPGTAGALASSALGLAPSLLLGYCSTANLNSSSGAALGDAYAVTPQRGTYELRVIGAGTREPIALSAQYSSLAEHRFWQAWLEKGLLQRSSPIAIRWASAGGNALPINVKVAAGTLTADVTARPGIYVLAAVPAGQRVPAWSSLTLKRQTTGGVNYTLVSRQGGAEPAFPYALFAVKLAQANVV